MRKVLLLSVLLAGCLTSMGQIRHGYFMTVDANDSSSRAVNSEFVKMVAKELRLNISNQIRDSFDVNEINLIAGSNITLNKSGKNITISATGGGGGSASWGSIGGTLSNQTDLNNALNARVPTSRTLSINGTSYDLSANRSWTLDFLTPAQVSTRINDSLVANEVNFIAGDNMTITKSGKNITFSSTGTGSGISSLNGLTGATQTFAFGTGTLGWSSSGSTHTLNIPDASGSTKGLLTAENFNTFNNKLSNITGLITAGSNLSLTGSGTSGSPYNVSLGSNVLLADSFNLTTTGTSGAATWNSSTKTLNIPNYTVSGFATLSGTQTFTGVNTFSGSTIFNTNSPVELVALSGNPQQLVFKLNESIAGFIRQHSGGALVVQSSGMLYLYNTTGTNLLNQTGLGTTPIPQTWANIAASTTARSHLRLNAGVNVTSPSDGDLWYNGTNLNFRKGSETIDLLGSVTEIVAGTNISVNRTGNSVTINAIPTPYYDNAYTSRFSTTGADSVDVDVPVSEGYSGILYIDVICFRRDNPTLNTYQRTAFFYYDGTDLIVEDNPVREVAEGGQGGDEWLPTHPYTPFKVIGQANNKVTIRVSSARESGTYDWTVKIRTILNYIDN